VRCAALLRLAIITRAKALSTKPFLEAGTVKLNNAGGPPVLWASVAYAALDASGT
jgi:hypothetical protein